MEYTAIIKEMSNGWYFAQCEQVPGAMTQGETIEVALENLKEAIQLVVEAERDHGIIRQVVRPLSASTHVGRIGIVEKRN